MISLLRSILAASLAAAVVAVSGRARAEPDSAPGGPAKDQKSPDDKNLVWSKKLGALGMGAHAGGSHGAPTDDYQLFLTGNPNQSFHPNFDYDAFNGLVELSYDFGPRLSVDLGADLELRRETGLYYTQVFYKDSGHMAFDEEDLITAEASRHYQYRQIGSYLQLHSAPFSDLPNFRLTGAVRADWITFGPVNYPAESSFRGAVAHRFGPFLTAKIIGGRHAALERAGRRGDSHRSERVRQGRQSHRRGAAHQLRGCIRPRRLRRVRARQKPDFALESPGWTGHRRGGLRLRRRHQHLPQAVAQRRPAKAVFIWS
jgi:hypothetical protein